MSALKLIYDKLKAGESFGEILKHRLGGTFFMDSLYIADGTGGRFIFWRHFGQSANRVSLQNLKWIISEVFKTTPEEFLYTYTTYNAWKKIDAFYKEETENVY